jgi:hypothetical protein
VEANLQKRNEERHKNLAEGANKGQLEISLCNHIRELQEKLVLRDCEVVILHLHVTKLQKVAEEKQCFINQVEANLCEHEKKLQEKCNEMHQMEADTTRGLQSPLVMVATAR